MGNYDGAEIRELVGGYILLHLEAITNKNEMGLYRGWMTVRGANDQKIKQNVTEIFKNIGSVS